MLIQKEVCKCKRGLPPLTIRYKGVEDRVDVLNFTPQFLLRGVIHLGVRKGKILQTL